MSYGQLFRDLQIMEILTYATTISGMDTVENI